MTHRSIIPTKTTLTWQQQLSDAITTTGALAKHLGRELDDVSDQGFSLMVTRAYADRIDPSNLADPLLRQIAVSPDEAHQLDGFSTDPLEEAEFNAQKGLIRKYQSRVLVTLTGKCAINCRYCFRRHFPYADNRLASRDRQSLIDTIESDRIINEVILSGGDPLISSNRQLSELFSQLEQIDHLKRIRIHTRLPLVLPDRVDDGLCALIAQCKKDIIIVWHVNHPNEIDHAVEQAARKLTAAGALQYNQSVLLRQVNDDVNTLAKLSESLIQCRIQPYYLHMLDKVQGAGHFLVPDHKVFSLYQKLCETLPGFLVPKLCREEAHKGSKTTFGSGIPNF